LLPLLRRSHSAARSTIALERVLLLSRKASTSLATSIFRRLECGSVALKNFPRIRRGVEEVRAHCRRFGENKEITRHPCSKTKPLEDSASSNQRSEIGGQSSEESKTSKPRSPSSLNGANGMSDMEGPSRTVEGTRVGARECGQRTSFKSPMILRVGRWHMAEFAGLVQIDPCRCQFRVFILGWRCGTRNTASEW